MKSNYEITCVCGLLLVLAGSFLIPSVTGQEGNEDTAVSKPRGNNSGGVQMVLPETHMDRPGEHHPDFGLPPGSKLEKSLKRLAKIDMDADLNYDGSINNGDSSDQGLHESVLPGMQIGAGELTKLVIRFKTYESTFPGEIYVTLEAAGINRLAATGKYDTDEEELDSGGRIRVWKSPKRKELLVDSGDLEKRSFEWKVEKETLATGVPGDLPRIIYVEGVEKSKKFEGDIRLLISASHSLGEGENRPPSGTYHTAYDHILFTVRENPIEKAFINNNIEGVCPEGETETEGPAESGEKPSE